MTCSDAVIWNVIISIVFALRMDVASGYTYWDGLGKTDVSRSAESTVIRILAAWDMFVYYVSIVL